jgi:hypothetical protein
MHRWPEMEQATDRLIRISGGRPMAGLITSGNRISARKIVNGAVEGLD